MSKQTITIEVEKDAYEVGKAIADVVVALKAKKPLPQIALEELPALEAAIDGIGNIPGDAKADFAGTLKAVLNPISDAIGALIAPSA